MTIRRHYLEKCSTPRLATVAGNSTTPESTAGYRMETIHQPIALRKMNSALDEKLLGRAKTIDGYFSEMDALLRVTDKALTGEPAPLGRYTILLESVTK